MQTIEFCESVTKIVTELKFTELLNTLNYVLDNQARDLTQKRQDFARLVFDLKSNLDTLSRTDTNANQIILLLGLRNIVDSSNLGTLITAVNNADSTAAFRNNSTYYRTATDLKLSLEALLRFQQTVQVLLVMPKQKSVTQGEAALDFEIVDVRNDGVGTDRLQAVLKIIQILHDTTARLLEVQGRLAIKYLDSGSNIIISIKSDHRIIDAFRKLVIDVWDRIRFGKSENLERKLQSAEAGIKFIEMVAEKQNSGVLDPAEAARLKHVAIEETLKLFGKATSLREIQTETIMDNRTLLLSQLDTKLLESGDAKQPEQPNPNPTQDITSK